LLGLRATPQEDSGFSMAELTYGIPLTLPGPNIIIAKSHPRIIDQLRAVAPRVVTGPFPEVKFVKNL
jgi:hypothetical protein